MKNNKSLKIKIILLLFTCVSLLNSKSWFNDLGDFIKVAYKNFDTVGAIAPFSKYTGQAMMKSIEKNVKKTLRNKSTFRFLEVGAGTGTLSQYFIRKLEKLKIDCTIDLVELNPDFCQILKEKFKQHPQVRVYCGDICKWVPTTQYDFIVSTLPFNCKEFTPVIVNKILSKYEKIMKEDGLLFCVEYAILGKIAPFLLNQTDKISYKEKHEILDTFRNKYLTEKDMVLRNIPPTYVYTSHIKRREIPHFIPYLKI